MRSFVAAFSSGGRLSNVSVRLTPMLKSVTNSYLSRVVNSPRTRPGVDRLGNKSNELERSSLGLSNRNASHVATKRPSRLVLVSSPAPVSGLVGENRSRVTTSPPTAATSDRFDWRRIRLAPPPTPTREAQTGRT